MNKKIAIISDIHGNMLAFEAVLADILQRGIEHGVCLGDVAALGPQPCEVIARLRETGFGCVMGNTDAWLLAPKLGAEEGTLAWRNEQMELWCAGQLKADDLAFMRSFKPTLEISLDDDTRLLACHGSPRANNENMMSATPEEDMDEMCAGTGAGVIAAGHTHVSMLFRWGNRLVINPGSVGILMRRKKDGTILYRLPLAEYAVLSIEEDKVGIEFVSIPYSLEAFSKAVRSSGIPYADVWLSTWREQDES